MVAAIAYAQETATSSSMPMGAPDAFIGPTIEEAEGDFVDAVAWPEEEPAGGGDSGGDGGFDFSWLVPEGSTRPLFPMPPSVIEEPTEVEPIDPDGNETRPRGPPWELCED